MASKPYLRPADDGTYELIVPLSQGLHILPYCFHTEEDARAWLSTRKGREHIRQLRKTMRQLTHRDPTFMRTAASQA